MPVVDEATSPSKSRGKDSLPRSLPLKKGNKVQVWVQRIVAILE